MINRKIRKIKFFFKFNLMRKFEKFVSLNYNFDFDEKMSVQLIVDL